MTQHYIGTKQILAWEQDSPKKVQVCGVDCKKGDETCNGYCTGNADKAPAAPAEPGYAVKYPDGYVSWSPKAVFEAAYLPMGHVGHMPDHQQRVIGEQVQLADKLAKLGAELNGALKDKVSPDEFSLLCEQERAMREYNEILRRRIANFESAR